jgi:hypothetical protein
MGKDGEERTVEMGAIMGAKTYYAVHEAEEFGGVSHEDGPAMSRIYRDATGKQIYPFEVKKDFSFKKALLAPQTQESGQTLSQTDGDQVRRLRRERPPRRRRRPLRWSR